MFNKTPRVEPVTKVQCGQRFGRIGHCCQTFHMAISSYDSFMCASFRIVYIYGR